jgi:hypothetical protein
MCDTGLTTAEIRDLRLLAGTMIPAREEFGVPGADALVAADRTVHAPTMQGHDGALTVHLPTAPEAKMPGSARRVPTPAPVLHAVRHGKAIQVIAPSGDDEPYQS